VSGVTASYGSRERINSTLRDETSLGRHKPDLVVCVMESLVRSMSTIRCPVAWFISELQNVTGFRDLIYPEEEDENKLDQAIPKISDEGRRALERFRKMEEIK